MGAKKDKKTLIKIKLDESAHLKEYEKELNRWESEGGRAIELNDIFKDIILPLEPGEVFEVLDGRFIFEDGDYFYAADIDLLSLH